MFVIVEGPDGAGKSTLVEALDRELWKRGRGCVLVNHKAALRRPALEEYVRDLSFYRPGGDVDLILDRSWLSEEVYGPVWRGQGLPPLVRTYLDAWADSRGAVTVYLDSPDGLLVERVCGTRGDDLVKDPDELRRLAADYRRLFAGAAHVRRYGGQAPADVIARDVVGIAERQDALAAPFADHPSYVGPVRPDVLLLGDRRSDTTFSRGYVTAFPPYPGSAAQQVLWPAVETIAMAGKTVGVANACEGDGLQLRALLGNPKAVALGLEAFQACEAPMAPHPRDVKKLFYERREEYRVALWSALQGIHALDHFGPADPTHREGDTTCPS